MRALFTLLCMRALFTLLCAILLQANTAEGRAGKPRRRTKNELEGGGQDGQIRGVYFAMCMQALAEDPEQQGEGGVHNFIVKQCT